MMVLVKMRGIQAMASQWWWHIHYCRLRVTLSLSDNNENSGTQSKGIDSCYSEYAKK